MSTILSILLYRSTGETVALLRHAQISRGAWRKYGWLGTLEEIGACPYDTFCKIRSCATLGNLQLTMPRTIRCRHDTALNKRKSRPPRLLELNHGAELPARCSP